MSVLGQLVLIAPTYFWALPALLGGGWLDGWLHGGLADTPDLHPLALAMVGWLMEGFVRW